MGGVSDKPNNFILDGQRFNAEEFTLAQTREGDAIPFDRKLTQKHTLLDDGYANRFTGDKDLPTGFQRVADLRSGANPSGPPSGPPKRLRKIEAQKVNRPVPSAGGASKRTRASKGATAAKAKSVLSNNPSDDKLG